MVKDPVREEVILVTPDDTPCGTLEKLEAHRRGVLHRALSVFIFDREGRLLLQRRAPAKYHSAGLWTNTCCSHPRPGEDTAAAAARRLREEMGLSCPLTERFSFVYRAAFPNGLIEHELDHVFFGESDATPSPDAAEADAWRHVSLENLQKEITSTPEAFTPWLQICLPRVIELRT